MATIDQLKFDLLVLLRQKSVLYGDFTLSSGLRSSYYVNCKKTTLDPKGAWLVGQVMYDLIRREQRNLGVRVDAVGGLTMGADPIAFAISSASYLHADDPPLQTFIVRKHPKAHGLSKLIEGNFQPSQSVVVIDDVITRGDSTISAIDAVRAEGGTVAFVSVLVDRQEGGREKIERLGYRVVSVFQRDDLAQEHVPSHAETNLASA
ncbi:MAG TPA: orotate phosphoribosyltransferase [Verrucomicrobiota bacterium]|nr:orotate phosphoribosyltransferase [Verrucomicrobiota bacterium]HNU53215.1 orotate phosphoribosyltransferase [Verrucomicrobiota bacterium]